jgi:uncharacterized protein
MTTRFVVIDTNVVVSGLITDQLDSPPARIVDAMLRGTFPFLLSLDLLAEYRAVLLRPKVQRLHGLTGTEVDAILTKITTNGLVKDPGGTQNQAKGLDPGDVHIQQLLETVSNAMLVTGDQALQTFLLTTTQVLSPQEFISENLEQE